MLPRRMDKDDKQINKNNINVCKYMKLYFICKTNYNSKKNCTKSKGRQHKYVFLAQNVTKETNCD